MTAKKITAVSVSGKRNKLAEALPLDTPYTVTIFPIYACNFKCNYCAYPLSDDKKSKLYKKMRKPMEFSLYKKIIDDFTKFPKKLKLLHFIGLGEPLMHPQIADMVRYAKEKNIAECIDIVTNASLLSNELSDKLIDAGLDRLRISLQGIDADTYKTISNIEIDFEKLKSNINYFYKHRENTKVYIKIVDSILEKCTENEFYNMFSNMADDISIEYLSPIFDSVKYDNDKKYEHSMRGNIIQKTEICPQPFYTMQIAPNGDMFSCCVIDEATKIGNIKDETILEVWNGEKLRKLRVFLLENNKHFNVVCKNCVLYKYLMYPEDSLDDYAKQLLKVFSWNDYQSVQYQC